MKSSLVVFMLLVPVAYSSVAHAQSQWKMADQPMVTRWGEEVTPENAWREYPRPQMVRSNWQNLNGLWEYAVVDRAHPQPDEWQGHILVPFCLESALSGVRGRLTGRDALWYRRTFSKPHTADERVLLHFEAVDYETQVWVNGTKVGSHTGGHVPFHFDITDAVENGESELIIRVFDPTNNSYQPKGKQHLRPHRFWYTAVSGIWQTVWLETVPQRYIDRLRIETAIEPARIRVEAALQGEPDEDETLEVIVRDGETIAARGRGKGELVLDVPDAKLWSPDSPFLYDLEVILLDGENNVIDQVESYTGIRTVGKKRDADGHLRFTLNNEFIFHLGPLDQGWWPDGLLTPPSDEAMVYDLQYIKDAGFNMIRKHVTVENRRYYYHTDRLGILIWQDHVSAHPGPRWVLLRYRDEPEDREWPDDKHEQWMYELKAMVDTFYNNPSIVVWVPFNERWGQHRTMKIGEWLTEYDRTRLLNIASGGNFFPVGDIADEHDYAGPRFPLDDPRYEDYVKVIGEFGGHGHAVSGHLWNQDESWGYGGAETLEELEERYRRSIRTLTELKKRGLAAGVYTQTTDIEIEINGLMTYDRRVNKLDPEWLREIHAPLYEDPPAVEVLVP